MTQPSPAPLTQESTGDQSGAATITPVPSTAVEPTGEPLETAAVAAHFPDPAVQYDTPGLRANRRSFTTNAELAQWLASVAEARQGTARAQLLNLGLSQQGMPIQAVALSGSQQDGSKPLEANGRLTVLLMGQQHGDEPASSEALLVIARELSQGLLEPMLERINVIIVPRANPDGAAADTHLLSDGTDLDRDHLTLVTPEARALAQLVRKYRPAVIADVHEYPVTRLAAPGGDLLPSHDVLLLHATAANVPEFVSKAAREWYLQPMLKTLDNNGLTHEWLYTAAVDTNGITATTGDASPDSQRNLGGLQNAVSIAIASRGAGLGRAHIQRRVHSLVLALTSMLRASVERGGNLVQVQAFVARDIATKACRGSLMVLESPDHSQRDLLLINAATGEIAPTKVNWVSSLQPHTDLRRPRPCGYWLAADTPAAERLRLLGLQVMQIAEEGSVLTEKFTGATSTSTNGEGVRTALDVPADSYFISLRQALANVAAAALEPGTSFNYENAGLLDPVNASARVVNNPSLVFDETE